MDGETRIENGLINALLRGAFVVGDDVKSRSRLPGSYRADIHHLELAEFRKDTTLVGDVDLGMEFSVANRLIFCMSLEDDMPRSVFKDCDSSWSIPAEKADWFANCLENVIVQSQQRHMFLGCQPGSTPLSHPPQLRLTYRYGPVVYGPKSIKLRSVSPETVEKTLDRLFDAASYKPKRFAHEREYRLVLSLTDEHNLFSAGKKPMFVNVPKIREVATAP